MTNRSERKILHIYIILCGLSLSAVACSSEDSDVDGTSEEGVPSGGEDAGKPPKVETNDAGATAADSSSPPRDSGSTTSQRDTQTTRDGQVTSAGDAGPANSSRSDGAVGDGAVGTAGPTTDAASADGNDASAGDPGTAPPASDYTQRGPYQVTTEKNVGKDFRNSNVTDQTAFCRSFVGGVNLPGEGNVDEELTNYPADMDRQLYTMFRPATLEEGKKYPVVTWGNGTCAQPLLYNEILEHWASWGIIVIASNATSVGSGREMLRGIDYLFKENTTEGSPLFGHIDTERVGASGHSQGSQGTVAAGADARIKATIPIQGASASGVRALKGPSFLISGEKDTLVTPSSVQTAFNAATVPAVYGMSVGQDHLMPGRMPMPILKAITGWFRIHLFQDDAARPLFYGASCSLCSDATWKVMRRNIQ